MTCGFPHLPPFWAHLVKLEAADRTAGVLMIPFSGCPVTPYPLTFPSEENSQWTGAAPSQTPFPLARCPPDTLESRACSCGGRGGCVAFIAFSPWILTSACSASVITSRKQLFHYDTFKKKKKKCICGLLPIYFYLIPFNCSAFKVFGEAPHGRTLQVSICWGLTALNGSHILTSTQAVKYRPDSPLHH